MRFALSLFGREAAVPKRLCQCVVAPGLVMGKYGVLVSLACTLSLIAGLACTQLVQVSLPSPKGNGLCIHRHPRIIQYRCLRGEEGCKWVSKLGD